jgi:hypothetical protein
MLRQLINGLLEKGLIINGVKLTTGTIKDCSIMILATSLKEGPPPLEVRFVSSDLFYTFTPS